VEVQCNAFPEPALQRELFSEGAGALDAAAGGTLLVSEPAAAPVAVQERLIEHLRAREDGHDVRLAVAETPPMAAGPVKEFFCADGQGAVPFVRLQLPPLRDRRTDIPRLARYFIRVLSARHGRPPAPISADAMIGLVRHHWPGNVRELRNGIEHAVMLADGGAISSEHLPGTVTRSSCQGSQSRSGPDPLDLGAALRQSERRYLLRVLDACDWNKKRAAEQLQISRSTLYNKIKGHALAAEA
jgi:DNA-binding NtrC family response regulator